MLWVMLLLFEQLDSRTYDMIELFPVYGSRIESCPCELAFTAVFECVSWHVRHPSASFGAPHRRRLLWDHFFVAGSFRCHPAPCTCGSWFLERLLVIKGRQSLSTKTSTGSLLRFDPYWFWISNGSDCGALEGKQHLWFVQHIALSRACHSCAPWSASARLWQHQHDPCGYPVWRARFSEGIWALVKGASVTCWNPQQGLAPRRTGGAFGTWFFHWLWLFSVQFRGGDFKVFYDFVEFQPWKSSDDISMIPAMTFT